MSLQCKIIFSNNADYFYEVEINVVPLYVFGIVLGSYYVYMRDVIFM